MTTRQSSRSDRTALAAALLPLAGCGGNGGGMGGVMQTDTGKGALFGGMGGDGRVELVLHPVRASA